MTEVRHYVDGDIDWETTFERMTGSPESAVFRYNLCRYLANSRNMSLDDGASVVNNANENGELLEVVVEQYPHVERRFYFIPRVRFEEAEQVVIPFWDYLSDEVDINNGDPFITDELLDRTIERTNQEISDRTLSAIDDHLDELAPVYTPEQLTGGRRLVSDEAKLYNRLKQ